MRAQQQQWQHDGVPFTVNCPISFYKSASSGPKRSRRIGGMVTTETRDRQNEIVLQKGLDFTSFLAHGWFNDNHSRDTDAVLGYPDKVAFFRFPTARARRRTVIGPKATCSKPIEPRASGSWATPCKNLDGGSASRSRARSARVFVTRGSSRKRT